MGYDTNVFEAEIGDEVIKPGRTGMLLIPDPKFATFIRDKKHRLSTLNVDGYSWHVEGKNDKTSVYARFKIASIESSDIKTVANLIIRGGEFVHFNPPQVYDPDADEDIIHVAGQILGKVSEDPENDYISIFRVSRPPIEIIRDRVKESLEDAFTQTNVRLINQICDIKADPDFNCQARENYHIAIRSQLEKAVRKLPGISPQDLHRMLDEIYCNEIMGV